MGKLLVPDGRTPAWRAGLDRGSALRPATRARTGARSGSRPLGRTPRQPAGGCPAPARARWWAAMIHEADESLVALFADAEFGYKSPAFSFEAPTAEWRGKQAAGPVVNLFLHHVVEMVERSEERRVGKECRSRWAPY